MAEEFFCPFVFCLHTVGAHSVRHNRWVVRLKWRVKEVEGDSGEGCYTVDLVDDNSRGLGSPWESGGLEEFGENLLETFKVVVGRFFSDGREFGRPFLEEDGELLNRVNPGKDRERLGRRWLGQVCDVVVG